MIPTEPPPSLRRDRSARIANRIAGGMLGLLLVSLLLGLFVPVYTDEVAWRFQLSRYLQDGGFDHSSGEACGANVWARPALFMVPLRLFSSGVTRWLSDPLTVRLAGVFFAIIGVAGVLAIVRRSAVASTRRATLEILVLALLGLGVLPLLLVWSRPEQPIWLALLAALLLGFARVRERAAREPVLRIAGIVMLASIAFGYHMKGLFYLPVFVLAALAAGRGCRRYQVRVVAGVLIAAAAFAAYRYWTARFACPDDPILAKKIGAQNLFVLLSGGGWRDYLGASSLVFANMLPMDYIRVAMPAEHYMSYWLPAAPVSPDVLFVWRRIVLYGWYLAMAIGVVLALYGVRDRWPRPWAAMAALIVIGCSTAWGALQVYKNSYEAALYLPTLVLVLIGLWGAPETYRTWLAKPVWIVAALSAVSQMLLIGSYAMPLWAATRDGGYIAGQPYSLSPYAYPRAQILAAGAKCGIGHGPEVRRVLIDDLTYFAFANTAAPMHRLGVLSEWNGSISDPLAWMRAHDSPGAVVACAYLPPAMRATAIPTGPICCVATR